MTASKHLGKIRYAVVGLGHIAQAKVLPAFAHAPVGKPLWVRVENPFIVIKRRNALAHDNPEENCR